MTRDEAIQSALRWYPSDAQLLHSVLSCRGANSGRPLWLLRFGRCVKREGFTRVISSSILIDDESGQAVGAPDDWE